MMPLSIRNQLSMRRYSRKVAKAQAEARRSCRPSTLQEEPRKKLREEQMKLQTASTGWDFPRGCLMMLIQIPIFFALFSARCGSSTRSAGPKFLWIEDLAGPDMPGGRSAGRFFDLGFFRFDAINLLPILMVDALASVHMRSMPKPADEQQAQQMKMMKWMPIFFAFILYNYTAALALYMVISSAFALVESKIVRRKDEQDQAEAAAAAPA